VSKSNKPISKFPLKAYLNIIAAAFLFMLFTLPGSIFAKTPDILATLEPTHPRVLIEPGGWVAIQKQAEADPLLAQLIEHIVAEADELLEAPLLERRKQGRRLLSVSREALRRISIWSMARNLTGDMRYTERAEAEMHQLVKFSDWNPSHFLDVAEMTAALAIGYDWLYHDLSEESRKTIREGLISHGLQVGIEHIRNDAWWATADINWNQVCLGGLTMGALAVADESPELARELLQAARSGITNGLSVYAPDGVYPEGPGYWSYGTIYQCLMIEAVRSALGTSWEMERTPGFLDSAKAQMHLVGPTGKFFNFCDGREGPSLQTTMFWFARELNRPALMVDQRKLLKQRLDAGNSKSPGVFPVLWWSKKKTNSGPPALPLAWKGDGQQPVAIFRSSWTDPDALYLACKGGRASLSHAHMDAGSFVLEAKGVRWAIDLGHQGYHELESKGISLWDKAQNGRRWDVFRLNNRSHNTLTIDDQLHRVDGAAKLIHFEKSCAKFDLSPVFGGQAETVTRRFDFLEHEVTITDHLQGLEPGANVRWTMATRAKIKVRGGQAILRQDGESLRVSMTQPPDGRLRVIPADPPDDGFNAPNPDTYLLIVDAIAPDSGEVDIKMHFIPGER